MSECLCDSTERCVNVAPATTDGDRSVSYGTNLLVSDTPAVLPWLIHHSTINCNRLHVRLKETHEKIFNQNNSRSKGNEEIQSPPDWNFSHHPPLWQLAANWPTDTSGFASNNPHTLNTCGHICRAFEY